MAHGGARKGAGRKPGSRNGFTKDRAERVEATAAAIEAVLPEAFAGDAHALLMAVYKDPGQEWSLRVDAAKAAVKFEKPALSSVEAKVTQRFEDMDREQLLEQIRVRAARVGLLGPLTRPQ